MKFDILKANIVNVYADAIVLPANEMLKEGSSTSHAIFEAAGADNLKKACDKIGHCDIGSAVPTSAFNLDARYIIHAVVPRWIDGEHNEYSYLSSAYLTSLKLADVMQCDSIVFPLLASGNNGFDKSLAFQIATESISSFESENLKEVHLVIYGDNTEIFVRSLGYDIKVVEDKTKPFKEASNDFGNIVMHGLKAAGDWLGNKDNQRKLVEFGFAIASIVFAGKGKALDVIDALKKLK